MGSLRLGVAMQLAHVHDATLILLQLSRWLGAEDVGSGVVSGDDGSATEGW